jgi:UDP-N-acetylmuramyl pentapeptide phosphotransferase/UDP-N-acetylglucosamine-1-phosphate transferase
MVVIWAFLISFLLTLVLMPLAITIGHHFKMEARPRFFRKSKSHRPIYYLGGTAVALCTIPASFVAAGTRAPLATALGAGLILVAVGFRENTRRLKSVPLLLRLSIQATLAGLVWLVEFQGQLPGFAGAAVAIVLLVWTANAFNLIDNMNGVAGMTSAGTAAGLTGLALLIGLPEAAAPAAALCGASLGFLRYNVVRARIFLGGGGPEFMGFVLGATALKVCLAFGPTWGIVSALTVLAVPLTDSLVTIASRIASGRPPFKGGVDHLSHRLLRLGLSTRRVAVLHGAAALAASVAAILATRYGPEALLAALVLFMLLGVGIALAGERKAKPDRSRRSVAPLALGMAILLLWSGAPTLAAGRDLYATRSALQRGMTSLKAFDVDSARQSFLQAEQLAARASKMLDSPLALPTRFIPIVGDNVKAARALAEGAQHLAPAAVEALAATDGFPRGPSGPQFGFNQGRLELTPWPNAEERLRRAAAGGRLALNPVRAANGMLVPPLSDARDKFLTEGNVAVETLEKAGEVAALLPYIFGADRPLTWFLAIQNPVELRATGGFLGAFGILRSERGRLRLERFDSNDKLPKVSSPPPAPQEFISHYDRFSARTTWSNVNMTPDFPTAAGVMAGMWKSGTGQDIDGVIAIDAVGLNHLLRVVGPVDVAPVGQITADNFLSLALNEAYIRFPQKENRATFLLEVGRVVWERLLTGNFPNPSLLVNPLVESVSGKHLQIWSPEQLPRLQKLGIAGELDPSEGSDFLMVVGQNAAGNKVDYYAHRRISYHVNLSNPADVRGRVAVQIENRSPPSGLPQYILGPYLPNDPPGLNRSYTSVFLPTAAGVLGASVDGAPVRVESHIEKGLGSISRFVEVPAGKTSTLSLSVSSALASPGLYKLRVQHQPNLRPDNLEIDIALPPGAIVLDSSEGMAIEDGHLKWRGELDSDKEFYVSYGSALQERFKGVLTAGNEG